MVINESVAARRGVAGHGCGPGAFFALSTLQGCLVRSCKSDSRFFASLRMTRRRLGGFLIPEALAAMAVLALGVFVLVAHHRAEVRELRATQETLCATLIAESEIERLLTLPYDDITPGPGQVVALSVPSAAKLKGSHGTLTVVEPEPGLKEAEVAVFWQPLRGPERSVSLRRTFSREGSGR